MPKKLTSYVHVNGKTYGPDDDVPADVAAQITTPGAWSTGDDPDPVAVAGDSQTGLAIPGPVVPDGDPSVTAAQVLPPPMGGAGSGVTEWLAYATAVGVEVPEGSREKRDDVVAVIRAAGKPVERTAQ